MSEGLAQCLLLALGLAAVLAGAGYVLGLERPGENRAMLETLQGLCFWAAAWCVASFLGGAAWALVAWLGKLRAERYGRY
jgi:hypothetical protein